MLGPFCGQNEEHDQHGDDQRVDGSEYAAQSAR
jgi:hypothetical protein